MILANDRLLVEISPVGAEPVRLEHCGTERLWQNEDGAWAGHAPVLFPVCGNCSKSFQLPRHGFARKRLFTETARTQTSVRFELVADAETRKTYPYDFRFAVTYTLDGDTLEIGYELCNLQSGPLPFGWGGHLSHRLFSPLGGHFLRFEKEERFRALLHNDEGLLTGEVSDMGVGKELYLTEEMLTGNTIILPVRSRKVALCNARGPLAELSFEGFLYLLLWRPRGARMLCAEPWSNLPDRTDGENSTFTLLGGGETASAAERIAYFEVRS